MTAGGKQGGVLAEFKICIQDEALKKVAPPSPSNVALVQQARNVQVVLFLAVLKFVSTEEAVNNAPNHFSEGDWRRG